MLTPVDQIVGETDKETQLLAEMANGARSYVSSFPWCPPIHEMYLAYGVGDVIALFMATFETKIAGTDDRLWLIHGDVPPAYCVVESGDCPREALERYCTLMDDWISAVLTFGSFDNIFPVAVPRTSANANSLRTRLEFVRAELIPKAPSEKI